MVYDPRIFGGGQHLSRDVALEAEGVQDDVEKEYFEKMNKMNGKEKSTFKEFLNQSFKEGAQTQVSKNQQQIILFRLKQFFLKFQNAQCSEEKKEYDLKRNFKIYKNVRKEPDLSL